MLRLTAVAVLASLILAPAQARSQASPAPLQSPVPATASPSPVPAPSPALTPNPYGYVVLSPPLAPLTSDAPQILEVDVNDKTIHPGGPLNVRVRTTPNIVAVEARAFGRFVPIPPAGPQTFALQYTLPCCLPFWLTGRNYEITIAAGTADGRQTTLVVPMVLART